MSLHHNKILNTSTAAQAHLDPRPICICLCLTSHQKLFQQVIPRSGVLDTMLQMHTHLVLIPCKNSELSSVMYLTVPLSLSVQSTPYTTAWLQVMRWLASSVAEVDSEVDLQEDDASVVSS